MARSARSRRSAGGTPRASRPISTLARTVSHGSRAKRLEHHGHARVGAVERLAAVERRVPPVGAMSPAMQRSRVDLPEPDLPSRATISPSRSSKLDVVEHRRAPAVGRGEVLRDVLDRDDGSSAGHGAMRRRS